MTARSQGSPDPRLLPWPEALRRRARQLAAVNVTVLIAGEAGVGKTLLARAIHLWGRSPEGPFERVDGASLQDGMARSDLFGHLDGAFTDAKRLRSGLIQRCRGGTLFLDEVHLLSFEVQALFLTLAEEGTVRPVGSDESHPANVRLIFGTNRDLRALVKDRKFLPDLLARIRATMLRVPPLRERRSDFREIVAAVIRSIEAKEFRDSGYPPLRVTEEAIEVLAGRLWHDNIRGLRNALVSGFVETEGGPLCPEHVRPQHGTPWGEDPASPASGREPGIAPRTRYRDTGAPDERDRIEAALRMTRGNVARAASELGISRSWLYIRLRVLGIDPDGYRHNRARAENGEERRQS